MNIPDDHEKCLELLATFSAFERIFFRDGSNEIPEDEEELGKQVPPKSVLN